MKKILRQFLAWIAYTRLIRSLVVHLIYPTIVRCLLVEVRPDVDSPSGVVEAFGWKAHSLLVRNEEFADGVNCCPDGLESTRASRGRILDVVLERCNATPGDILEFGVSSGESFLKFLDLCANRQVYGFDSWEGLPEDWWTRPKGSFASTPPVFNNPNGHLVKGWFDESIPQFLREWDGCVAVLHIDCDLYSSTATAFQYLLPKCTVGTIVLFDEYWNYPDFAQHEWRAWREFRIKFSITADCIAYDGRRAAFQIRKMSSEWSPPK